MPGLVFSKLEIEGWRQFDDINIDIHPRLTVITGANGSGKSTLLSLFTHHFGWSTQYLSTPVKDDAGVTSYIQGILASLWHRARVSTSGKDGTTIGKIFYSNGNESAIIIPPNRNVQYPISFTSQSRVFGVHIDSYRSVPIYSQVGTIPLLPMTAQTAYANYNTEIVSKYNGSYSNFSPIFRMKEAIISMAVFGEGNTAIGKNQSLIDIFKGFNDILAKMLPESLGFQKLSVRSPDVVLVTRSGEFLLDASSGGIMTLIDISWRIYMFAKDASEFVVTMDEPENHLHPSMQRSLMRRLLDAFPNVQFIIATHSPLMVSSVKSSNVYVLRYEAGTDRAPTDGLKQIRADTPFAPTRVKSISLNNINKAGSASEILREVLGVPATIPEWVEEGVQDIVSSFKGREITPALLGQIRESLAQLGYGEYFSEALAGLTQL